MEVEELLKRAWGAVEGAGIPEPLQETALKEAIGILRDERAAGAPRGTGGGAASKATKRKASKPKADEGQPSAPVPDEATFFSQLASESGRTEDELRDTIQLRPDGEVRVTTPKKDLGNTITKQARAVIALVAAARAEGLGENPVDAQKVRDELARKGCYDKSNFSNAHLRPMKGFNSSGTGEIVLTSKWVTELDDVMDKIHGSKSDAESDSKT